MKVGFLTFDAVDFDLVPLCTVGNLDTHRFYEHVCPSVLGGPGDLIGIFQHNVVYRQAEDRTQDFLDEKPML